MIYHIGEVMNERTKKTIIIFMIFAIVVLFPLTPFLLSNSTREVTLNTPNREKFYNLKTAEIKQKIIVQGRITKLGIYFDKLQTNYKQDECIEVIAKQGKRKEKIKLGCAEILDEQINYLDVNWSVFHDEYIEITIVQRDLSGDILVYLCNDEQSALDGVIIDGDKKNAPICMEYKLFVDSSITSISVCLFFVLAILLIAGAVFVQSEWKHAWCICSIISFFIIILIICIRQPTASYLGEPRSEAAYEFWKQAKYEGFWKSILNLECGLYYLSFIQRITAWLAVSITPDVKYVFVIMQMIQTLFIAFSCCMVWSRKLLIDLSKINRFLVSVLFGSCMVTTLSYYLHFMGYWGMLFIIFFSLLDMQKVNKYFFVLATIFAAICCLSKMVYVVAIPCVICYALYKNKRLTYRNVCWMLSILAGCMIQVIYTFTHTTLFQINEGLGTIQSPSWIQLINGLLYYAVQGVNTFLFNSEHSNVWYTNMVLFCLVLVAIVVFIYRLIYKNSKNIVMIGLLGVMYFSVLGFTMLTSAGGFDMLNSIDWNVTGLLNHQHFAFIKIILCLMALILFEECFSDINKRKVCTMIFLAFIAFSNMPINDENESGATSKVATFPTDWKNISWVTKNESYYVPINVGYPFALISLTENSYGILIGYDENGEWKQLPMAVSYPKEIKYHKAVLGDLFDTDANGILSISTRRSNTYLDSIYDVVVYDKAGKIIMRKQQCNSSDRYWIDFMFDEPLYNAYCVEFINTTTGHEGYVSDALNIGIDNFTRINILDKKEGEEILKRMDELEDSIRSIEQSQISVEYCNNELILGTDSATIMEGDNAEIKGWAVNHNTLLPFSEVYAIVDNVIIKGNMGLRRKDVEEAYGKEQVLNSGFVINIPQKLLMDTSEMQLVFMDSGYKEIRSLKIYHNY